MSQTPRGTGAIDPFWVDPVGGELLSVLMTPGHAVAYQRWLRSNNLHLFLIPNCPVDDPYYAVGVRYMPGDEAQTEEIP